MSRPLRLGITLTEVVRGQAAWQRVKNASRFFVNPPPDPGFQYIVALFRVEVINGPEDAQFTLSSARFSPMSSEGEDYPVLLYIVDPEPPLFANLSAGDTYEGWATFLVPASDMHPLVAFNLPFIYLYRDSPEGREYLSEGVALWKLYE